VTVALAHYRAQMREYGRHPSFTVPSLALPALFFLFFVFPRVDAADVHAFVVAYAAFALLGIVFFQFGVGIAVERAQPWERYLRTLPARPAARFAARLLTALTFGAAATATVVVTAVAATHSAPAAGRWPGIGLALVAGALPHALLGIALGYLASPRGALPLANLLYLLLSYLGGLWTTAEHLPRALERASLVLPTRQWAELLWAAENGRTAVEPLAAVAAYTLLFGAIAVWAYRRDEGERFT
jgi:ABC-2 type transport system permease protein